MEEDQHAPSKLRQRPVRFVPSDVLHDILLCLPARRLLKFRFACKSWLSSITNPAFISSHTERSTNSPTTDLTVFRRYPQDIYIYNHRSRTYKTLLLNELLSPDSSIDFPPHPQWQILNYVIASVNGLLLLCSNKTIYVCNPCTREIVALPPLDNFDPYSIGTVLGFGVDPSTGKYKVLLFVEARRCHVFTQGAQSWGRAGNNLTNNGFRPRKNSVFFNGLLYWVISSDEDSMILSFDFKDEEFALLPAPPLYHGDGFRRVEQLQGNLCLVDLCRNNCVIWVMKKPKHEWIKSYNIEIRIPEEYFPQRYSRLIAIVEGNYFLIATIKGLFWYNQKSKKLTTLFTSEPRDKFLNGTIYIAGKAYTETLASAS